MNDRNKYYYSMYMFTVLFVGVILGVQGIVYNPEILVHEHASIKVGVYETLS
jgi:hypothetical protein